MVPRERLFLMSEVPLEVVPGIPLLHTEKEFPWV